MAACLASDSSRRTTSRWCRRSPGPEAAGRWTGVQNGLGNCAGIVAPWVTGAILNATHSFFLAFATACGVLAAGSDGILVRYREEGASGVENGAHAALRTWGKTSSRK